jgi:hypothetical protein
MLTDTSRWSHAHGNEVVPSRWQATPVALKPGLAGLHRHPVWMIEVEHKQLANTY